MININLLPWREEEHRKQKSSLFISLGSYIAIMVIIIVTINFSLNKVIAVQKQRNQILQQEIQNTEKIIQTTQSSKNELVEIQQKLATVKKLYNSRRELMLALNNINNINLLKHLLCKPHLLAVVRIDCEQSVTFPDFLVEQHMQIDSALPVLWSACNLCKF